MLEFLTKLKTKQTETAISKRDEWLALVVAVCDGDEPAEDAVLATLEHCGKTIEDLQQAVELVNRRREWTTQMASIPAAQAEVAAIEDEKKAARGELFDAQSKYNERIKTLSEREQANIVTLATAEEARRSLVATATEPSLAERQATMVGRIRRVTVSINDLLSRRFDLQKDISSLEKSSKHDPVQLSRMRYELGVFNSRIAGLEAEQREIEAERESIQQEKLEVMAL